MVNNTEVTATEIEEVSDRTSILPPIDLVGRYSELKSAEREMRRYLDGTNGCDARYRNLRHTLLFDECQGDDDEDLVPPVSYVRPIRRRLKPISEVYEKGDQNDSIARDDRAHG